MSNPRKTKKNARTTKDQTKADPKAPKALEAGTPATDAMPAKAPKVKKAPAAPKPKRVSLLDAAAQVLGASGGPMNCKAMVEQVVAKGLWSSPKGLTPWATLYSAILREINEKKNDARFKKTDRGLFAFNPKATSGGGGEA